MFGHVGVFDLMLPAFLMSTTLWNIPPVRVVLICSGLTLGILRSF